MNFSITNGKIQNKCFSEQGQCCANCKYVTNGKENNQQWIACSDSCLRHPEIKKYSCEKCAHTKLCWNN